jgi:hypothetical protein
MRGAHRIARGLTATNLLAVAPEDTLGEVAQKMLEQETRTALVLDSGRIIGALSARELVHAAAERTHPSDGRVREWMVESEERDGGDGALARERGETVCELAWETGHLEICRREACSFWWKGRMRPGRPRRRHRRRSVPSAVLPSVARANPRWGRRKPSRLAGLLTCYRFDTLPAAPQVRESRRLTRWER